MTSSTDNSIVLCSDNTFISENTGELNCENCLENGICEGGYRYIYP